MNRIFGNFEYDLEKGILNIELENAEIVYYDDDAIETIIHLVGGEENAKMLFGFNRV